MAENTGIVMQRSIAYDVQVHLENQMQGSASIAKYDESS